MPYQKEISYKDRRENNIPADNETIPKGLCSKQIKLEPAIQNELRDLF